MAKYQFADQARKLLEEQGIVINDDGSTGFAQGNPQSNPQFIATGEPEQTQETEEQTTPPAENYQGAISQLEREELEQLRAEKEKWGQQQTAPAKSDREIELEEQLADLRSQLASQTEAQQADEIRELLEREGFDSENLDDDVLIELRDRFVKPLVGKLDAVEQRLKKFDEKLREPTPEERLQTTKETTINKVVEAIPDFHTVFKSAAFQKRLAEKDDRFPTPTYGHTLQVALENGDHAFITREVKAFLGGIPQTLGGIADVGGTNGVGTTVAAKSSDGFTYSDEEATQMFRKRQQRLITKQEYSEYRAKLDAHRSGK